MIRALLVLTSTLLTLPALAADPIRPDQVLTPGRVLTHDTAKVCVPHYSETVRNTSAALKRRVFLAYGIEPRGSSAYEIDHRLPLSLGGADVAENLWPETRDRRVRANAWAKDRLESLVHRLVCIQHTMTLAAAQRLFLGDWLAAHRKLIGPL